MSDSFSNAADIDRHFAIRTPDGERVLDAYSDEGFEALTNLWLRSGWQQKVSYRLHWLGVQIIQMPEDILVMQELIWRNRPDVIVECGVAHGGSTIFYASILELIGNGRVIGVDVEIRGHNRAKIESHPLRERITLIEGDSASPDTAERVRALLSAQDKVMVTLDSNHTRDHVAKELEVYAPLVSSGQYLVVFDGVMRILHDAPDGSAVWRTDNPTAAADEFLERHPEFEPDPSYERLGATYCPRGFLRRRD